MPTVAVRSTTSPPIRAKPTRRASTTRAAPVSTARSTRCTPTPRSRPAASAPAWRWTRRRRNGCEPSAMPSSGDGPAQLKTAGGRRETWEGEAPAEPGPPSSARLAGRLALPIAVALAIAAALAWWKLRVEVPAGVRALDVNNYDAYVYYYPTFDYAFRELAAGRFPFWNPHQHCGSPFFATGQHLLLYPLNFFFLLLPTAAAMQATAVLHLALGLLFTA